MAAGEIRVTSTELRSKRAEMVKINNLYKENVGRLVSNEQKLVNESEGDAIVTFNNEFNNNVKLWNEFGSLVDNFADTLEKLAEIYDSYEAKNVSLVGSTKG